MQATRWRQTTVGQMDEPLISKQIGLGVQVEHLAAEVGVSGREVARGLDHQLAELLVERRRSFELAKATRGGPVSGRG
jgi:hypothetical protein